ncbi:MAG: hypothetical protein JW891_08830 [Candidatus Lokiarchaeota archaeon]|nr:hypothetical protein [Candidatus Lokiarchaeota archaeon]
MKKKSIILRILLPFVVLTLLSIGILMFRELSAVLLYPYGLLLFTYIFLIIFTTLQNKTEIKRRFLKFYTIIIPLLLLIISVIGLVNSIYMLNWELKVFWTLTTMSLIIIFPWLLFAIVSKQRDEKREEKINAKYKKISKASKNQEQIQEIITRAKIIQRKNGIYFLILIMLTPLSFFLIMYIMGLGVNPIFLDFIGVFSLIYYPILLGIILALLLLQKIRPKALKNRYIMESEEEIQKERLEKSRRKVEFDEDGRKIILKFRGANFFGQESKGVAQIRGNGNLILYKNELFFKQWLPKKIISIPLKKIKSVDTTSFHIYRYTGRPLLKVVFENEKGQNDSVAWIVGMLDRWITTINSLIQEQTG